MDNNFLTESEYINKGGNDLLFRCIEKGFIIEGSLVRRFVYNNFDLVIDSSYEDFGDCNRWTIAKYYILHINNKDYRIWQAVGLTESQEDEWYDQFFEPVEEKYIIIKAWNTFNKGENV